MESRRFWSRGRRNFGAFRLRQERTFRRCCSAFTFSSFRPTKRFWKRTKCGDDTSERLVDDCAPARLWWWWKRDETDRWKRKWNGNGNCGKSGSRKNYCGGRRRTISDPSWRWRRRRNENSSLTGLSCTCSSATIVSCKSDGTRARQSPTIATFPTESPTRNLWGSDWSKHSSWSVAIYKKNPKSRRIHRQPQIIYPMLSLERRNRRM